MLRVLVLLHVSSVAYAAAQAGQLFSVSATVQTAFLWTSIGVAVVTAFLQGMVSALAFMTEDSNNWTFRFRLAKVEHWWWSLVAALLIVSLVLSILSFLSGGNSDSLGTIALASAASLTIVQYTIPAWRCRHFITNRWLAWTGDSRTSIDLADAPLCGDEKHWQNILAKMKRSEMRRTPSDWYGWRLYPVRGIPEDPTDVLRYVKATNVRARLEEAPKDGRFPASIFDDGNPKPVRASLLWGGAQQFRRRNSRAISSMPTCLLKSKPLDQDGYAGEGLCLAMGILGRNKGLDPKKLIFDTSKLHSSYMEDHSTWEPRPAKVLRSCYTKTMEAQYHGLDKQYVQAAVELSLLLVDCPEEVIAAWLTAGLEHQCLALNVEIRKMKEVKPHELEAHYQSSYVSMILSLNFMANWITHHHGLSTHSQQSALIRPDLICTGILLMARDLPKPAWWDAPSMHARRMEEDKALGPKWRHAALRLLGMSEQQVDAAGGESKLWCFDLKANENKLSSNNSGSDVSAKKPMETVSIAVIPRHGPEVPCELNTLSAQQGTVHPSMAGDTVQRSPNPVTSFFRSLLRMGSRYRSKGALELV